MTYTNCTQQHLPIYIKVIFEQKALGHLPKLYQLGANFITSRVILRFFSLSQEINLQRYQNITLWQMSSFLQHQHCYRTSTVIW